MSRYLAERVAWLLLSLLTLSIISFGLGVLAPGDPAEVVLEHRLNQSPPHKEVLAQRRLMGLDRPLAVQYVRWLSSAARGDLGHSWLRGLRVSDALRERIPRTAALAGSAAVISVLFGVPAGVLAATRRNSFADHACRLAALVGASVPSYFAAYVLILVCAVRLRALPVFGFGSAGNLVLPAVTLGKQPSRGASEEGGFPDH